MRTDKPSLAMEGNVLIAYIMILAKIKYLCGNAFIIFISVIDPLLTIATFSLDAGIVDNVIEQYAAVVGF